ncbi:MAG: hypothetical protein AVDCRST_MAG49-712 [uncultured Thermomicrobiales bacterium]|uniref:Uncharacterized protein n=1 Tax=uncultured Thermomicrobiales bacterium TaxID=1645740 RepID=A0A6J4U357_9BACT|nr:MAG: hypothetical protein AVDCRST_MAG49-712 [uncultured Thermomicrobiales bacterium]
MVGPARAIPEVRGPGAKPAHAGRGPVRSDPADHPDSVSGAP